MKIRVRVKRAEQFGRLGRRFREAAEGGLRDELGSQIRKAAPSSLLAAQTAVRRASFPAEVPSTNKRTRTTGLRERLATATKTAPLTSPPGVRFYVDGSTVNPADPRGGHALARYTDVELAPRWRHQTFGRVEAKDWYRQLGQPWFASSIRPDEPKYRTAVERAMERVARRILR